MDSYQSAASQSSWSLSLPLSISIFYLTHPHTRTTYHFSKLMDIDAIAIRIILVKEHIYLRISQMQPKLRERVLQLSFVERAAAICIE